MVSLAGLTVTLRDPDGHPPSLPQGPPSLYCCVPPTIPCLRVLHLALQARKLRFGGDSHALGYKEPVVEPIFTRPPSPTFWNSLYVSNIYLDKLTVPRRPCLSKKVSINKRLCLGTRDRGRVASSGSHIFFVPSLPASGCPYLLHVPSTIGEL